MKLVIQRLNKLVYLLLDDQGILGGLVGLLLLVGTDVHKELCNLVRVLARSRHFDWTCPVEIEVTQSISQVLKFKLCQVRVILGNVEVSGQDATLRG